MKTKHVVLLSMAVSIMGCTSKNQTIGISLQNLDTTVVAQDDFYHYACGGWMKANPLTAEYSRYGSFDVVAENVKGKLGIEKVCTNSFTVEDGKLTGEVTGPLVSGSKLDVLNGLVEEAGITLDEVVAVIDNLDNNKTDDV